MERVHDRQDDGRGDGAERAVVDEVGESVLAAWRSLPEAFRALLWGLVVHDERPHRAGLGPAAVTDRGERARDRLRLGLRSELVARASTPECAAARRRLGGVRDPLSGPGRGRGGGQAETQREGADERDVEAGARAHVEACAPCRAAAAMLDDVDRAIRTRVAPALLPGAFAAEAEPSGSGARAEATVAAAVWPAAELAGDRPHGEASAARVLTVPRRSVSLVAASASLVLAVVLLILGSKPGGSGGSLIADPPMPSGPSVANGVATAVVVPEAAASLAGARSLIGVAVAESPPGADGAARKADRDSTGAAPSAAGRASASSPSAASPSPRPSGPPSRGVAIRTLAFDPAERGTFVARVAVSPGWLVTSVVDGRGRRVVEHVSAPTTRLEQRLQAGHVVVTVRRVTGSGGVSPGALSVSFVARAGSVLPGSGTYVLP